MAVVLSTHVDVFDGVTQFSARPAVIELTDTNLFTLTKIDPATGVRGDILFNNVPVSELNVRGTQSTLKFTHNGFSRRVDFSFGSRVAGAFGIIGLIAASRMIKKSGIGEWTTALKAAGATIRYWSQGRIIGITVIFVVVIIIVVVAVTVGSAPS